jgi:hypothetical protein
MSQLGTLLHLIQPQRLSAQTTNPNNQPKQPTQTTHPNNPPKQPTPTTNTNTRHAEKVQHTLKKYEKEVNNRQNMFGSDEFRKTLAKQITQESDKQRHLRAMATKDRKQQHEAALHLARTRIPDPSMFIDPAKTRQRYRSYTPAKSGFSTAKSISVNTGHQKLSSDA